MNCGWKSKSLDFPESSSCIFKQDFRPKALFTSNPARACIYTIQQKLHSPCIFTIQQKLHSPIPISDLLLISKADNEFENFPDYQQNYTETDTQCRTIISITFIFCTFQSAKSNLKTKWLYLTSPLTTKYVSGAFLGAGKERSKKEK